jgi:hypothetical protein
LDANYLAVRPGTKRNGITLSLVGCVLLLLGLMLLLTGNWFAQGLLAFFLGAVATILGVAKLIEPEMSIELSPEGLKYYHRRGNLFIAWDNIQRIDIPRVNQGLEMIELPFIGVRLKYINPVLDNISPRLATGLLTEQRPLLMTAAAQDELLEHLEHYLSSEFAPLIVNGERYRGVLAMFGHRSELLATHLGYHLYIPRDSLDREPGEFVQLLKAFAERQRAALVPAP